MAEKTGIMSTPLKASGVREGFLIDTCGGAVETPPCTRSAPMDRRGGIVSHTLQAGSCADPHPTRVPVSVTFFAP